MTTPEPAVSEGDQAVVLGLLAAMVRVLSGTPATARPGNLTITAVATEAGLKRHHLTHKHTELKELFYQLRDNHANPVKDHAASLTEQVSDLKQKLADAHDQRRKWKATAETYARAINILTLENAQLREQDSALPAHRAVPLRRKSSP